MLDKLLNQLLGSGSLTDEPELVHDQAYEEAVRAARRALGQLLKAGGRSARAARAVHAHDVRGLDDRRRAMEASKGRRLLRHLISRSLGGVTSKPQRDWRPGTEWLAIEQAVLLTGYSRDHVGWIYRNHAVRHFTWRHDGRKYIRRGDLLAYKRQQAQRGYGPR